MPKRRMTARRKSQIRLWRLKGSAAKGRKIAVSALNYGGHATSYTKNKRNELMQMQSGSNISGNFQYTYGYNSGWRRSSF